MSLKLPGFFKTFMTQKLGSGSRQNSWLGGCSGSETLSNLQSSSQTTYSAWCIVFCSRDDVTFNKSNQNHLFRSTYNTTTEIRLIFNIRQLIIMIWWWRILVPGELWNCCLAGLLGRTQDWDRDKSLFSSRSWSTV